MAMRAPKDLVKLFAKDKPDLFPRGDAFGLREKYPELVRKWEEQTDQEYADKRVQAGQTVRQAAYEHQKDVFDPHWMGLDVVPGVGPGIVAQIAKPARMKRWKELLTSMKEFKRGSATIRKTLDGIKRLEKNIPQSVWDYVDDIEIDPELGALGEWAGGARKMRFNPKEMRPLTTFHETGHAVSSLVMSKTRFGTSLARLRNKWGAVTGDMNILHKLMEAGYVLDKYGDLPAGQETKLNNVINLLYKGQPEEIFARTFERAFAEGHNLKQSVKMGTRAVQKTLKQVSKFYDQVSPLHGRLKKSAEINKALVDIEKEAEHLIEWLNNPVWRRIEAEYKIGQILEKRGYGTVTKGTKTPRAAGEGDIMDIVGGWSFHDEKDLRAIASMLEGGASVRAVRKKFPPTVRNVGEENWLDDQFRLVSTLIYGDEPKKAIKNIMEGIDAGGSGMIRSEIRDVTKEIAE